MNVNTKALRAALQACSAAIENRTLPILTNVRLESNGSTLTLFATDLNVFIERRVECDGILPPCCIGHKLLMQVLEQVQAESVEIRLENKLVITDSGSKSVSRLGVLDAKDFPLWPVHPVKPIAVNCIDLANALDSVSWACAKGDRAVGNPKLENIAVILSAKEMNCIGFEGRIFAHYGKASICGDYACRLPAEFSDPIVTALNEPHSLLSGGENNLCVEHEHGRTAVKLSELQYSTEWQRFLAQKNGSLSLRVKTDDIKRACVNCMNFHDDKLGPQLNIDWQADGRLILETAGTLNEDRREVEHMGATGSGQASLNASLLIEGLRHMGEEIQFTPVESASFWQSGDLTVIVSQLRRPVKT